MNEKITILIADDDRLNLISLHDALNDAGYNVLKAENGLDAVEIGLQNNPDIAVLDIKMPKLDGFEVARCLYSEKNIPFLFLTAYSDEELVQKATQDGALGYIVKPIDIDQLIPIIKTSLERARELQELKASKEHLRVALNSNREISEAIGILVGQGRANNKDDAFEMLRRFARKKEMKVKDVAFTLVKQVSETNQLIQEIAIS